MTPPSPDKPSRWGWLPTILYVSFVVGLLSLARIAIQSPPALVQTDYYEEGLRHDQTMTAEANARALGITLEFVQTDSGLSVTLPSTPQDPTLHFQRPSDASADSSVPLNLIANSATLPPLRPGLWRYTFTCTQDHQPCTVRGSLHIK